MAPDQFSRRLENWSKPIKHNGLLEKSTCRVQGLPPIGPACSGTEEFSFYHRDGQFVMKGWANRQIVDILAELLGPRPLLRKAFLFSFFLNVY